MHEEYLLQVVYKPYVSEKTSTMIERTNTIAVKVHKNATKSKIKSAMQKLFAVKVKSVNTLIIKGKIKHREKYISRHRNWKKAYVTLEKGQNLDSIEDIK